MPFRHVLLALMVVAIWGVNFTVIKLSVTLLPPFLAAALRFAFAAFPALLFIRPPHVSASRVVLFGLFSGFALYSFLNLALYFGMPAGLSSVVLQTQAFFTITFAFFLLGERPRLTQILGAGIAFAGIGVIAVQRMEGATLVPLLMVLAAAICWAVANIITKRSQGAEPIALTVWGAAVATTPLLLTSLAMEGVDTDLQAIATSDIPTWLVIGFLAYAATLFGLGTWTYLLHRHPASIVAPFTLLVPITGLISGAVFLGETISAPEAIGSVLVIAGLLVPVLRHGRTV